VTPSNSSAMKLVVSRLTEDSFVPGRREFLMFRDLGVANASSDRYGAVVIDAKVGMKRATGWHYHECDLQFVYILRGWAEMEFEDGTQAHLSAGESAFIPGGMVHQEVRTSDDLQALEVTSPATMGTVPCEAPAGR
jgi:mannose-6-phosphate isomerase-like protein (cupin superfamily)